MYIRLLNAGGILRRYFIMNGFDGIMTVMGIIMGSYITHSINPKFIVGASIGASIAMGISGFVGAFITERAERIKEIKDLERSLFTSLEDSVLKQAVDIVTVLAALIDALAPMLFSLISVMPFMLAICSIISLELAMLIAIVLISILLFSLGAFLARISDENVLKYGLYMLISGLLISVIGVFLEILL
ncbi:MAG: hypothetical protein DRJ52_04085 [Thermoprotei archaeon]|nr:MAG: hypothetical protein DRJ52_04085 [Thermoprotei archaeon]RLE99060.1 MAG: hypothetical protein DRJ63_06400 [Thermoprotei archaeon]